MSKIQLWRLMAVGALCFASFAAVQAQVSATAQLSTDNIMIGDQITLKLNANYDSNAKILGFDLSLLDSLSGIEVIGVKPAVKPAEGFLEQQLTITAFDSGTYTLPPFVLRYERQSIADSVLTPSLTFEVRTIPIQSDSTALQPIKDIIVEPRTIQDFMPYLIGLVVLILLAALVYWLVKRPAKKIAAPPPPPPVPPHETALKKLAALRQAAYWEKGELKAYYSELTYILREYLEGRFAIKALESTSDEIIRDIKPMGWEENYTSGLADLLRTADLVKFAKATPPADSHTQRLDLTEAFVQATIPAPAPDSSPNPGGGSHAAN